MSLRINGLMGLVMGLMALTATARTPTRVEITAQPDGARIVVDGEVRGTAPLQLFDLTPGRHLFHVEATGYRTADAYLTVGEEGSFLQKHFELEQEKALILVQSDPAGAEVRNQGMNLGQTPLFVSSLPTDAT